MLRTHQKSRSLFSFISSILLVIVAIHSGQAQTSPDIKLKDSGPVWEGITDTTSFRARMQRHIQSANQEIQNLLDASEPRTVVNTVNPYLSARDHFDNADRLSSITLNAHPDSAYRTYAQKWNRKIAERKSVFDTNPNIYNALKAVDLSQADSGLRYVINRNINAYERNGVNLNDAKREQATLLRSKINKYGNQFERNIFTKTPTLTIHKDSLVGVPNDWIESHEPDEEGFISLNLNQSNFVFLVSTAEIARIRLLVAKSFLMRTYPENLTVLDSLRSYRFQLAELLGYDSWAGYVQEPMMAGSPDRVQRFLTIVDSTMARAIAYEQAQLLEFKESNPSTGNKVELYDYPFLRNKLRESKYNYNAQALREYFPYKQVRDGIFVSFEQLFEIDIRSTPEIPVWSAEVEPYEVWENDILIGRFYLDMYARKGKFDNPAEFALKLGNHSIPETSLLINFLNGKQDSPNLLTPGQVVTIFHEFGHLMHTIFRGSQNIIGNIEQDFIEAPAVIQEAWARSPKILSRIGRHFKTEEPIPEDLMTAYSRSQKFSRAPIMGIHRAMLSLQLYKHPPNQYPASTIEKRILDNYSPFKPNNWYHPATIRPHLYPYSSNEYTYLWSEAIGHDLLNIFNQDNLLDPEIGRRYQETLLARSGTAPIENLIEDFLGRPFNAKAWRDWVYEGIEGESDFSH